MHSFTLYPLANYTFGSKDAQPEEDSSVQARMDRLERDYRQQGMRHTVEAIILVHEHNHPHVLMLQVTNSFFKLPGNYLKPDEDEISGLKRVLTVQLSPDHLTNPDPDWQIGECLCTWWRPNFETYMYPYLAPHVSRPKERKNLYLVHLPERKLLSVPRNMKLVAVPLMELNESSSRYGAQLSALPMVLSRFNIECISESTDRSNDTERALTSTD
ncbi:Cleavage/polyadenylation specificity factor subunit 5 [Syncephalis plumigaleata]|nr:Cleavage/polyadenylation specificity factor subunit 5 [Syncephalis plumigaleata]